MVPQSEPKAFQLCFEILQYEHENTPTSLQLMLTSMNQLPLALEDLNERNLLKVRRNRRSPSPGVHEMIILSSFLTIFE